MKRVVTFLLITTLLLFTGGLEVKAIATPINTYAHLSLMYTDQNDTWGKSIAWKNEFLVIGSSEASGSTTANDGSIRVYNTDTNINIWNQINPNIRSTSTSDYFGHQLVISNNKLFVSAYREKGVTGKNAQGTVYVYDVTNGNYLAQIENPDVYTANDNDYFGITMVGNENYLMVSATGENSSVKNDVGVVYIFDVDTYDLIYTITSPNYYEQNTSQYFGMYTAITDKYFLIGDPYENDGYLNGMGVVYVYSQETGQLIHTIINPNEHTRSPYVYDDSTKHYGFGIVVANKFHIVIGDPLADTSTVTGRSGKVYIYDPNDFSLKYTVPNIFGEENLFGASLGLDRAVLSIGVFRYGVTSNINSGVVSMVNANTGVIEYNISNPNYLGGSAGDYFGKTVVVNEGKLAIGAPRDYDTQTFKGTVYTFNVDEYAIQAEVSFESNGGTVVNPIMVEEGGKISKPDNPSKTNYNFVGWYKNSNLTEEWNFNTDTVNEDITLYAKWVSDVISKIDGRFEGTFLGTMFGKIFTSILLIVGITMIFDFVGLPKMIILLLDIILLMMFIVIGWIPFWIIFLITLIAITLLVMLNKGGGSND